MSKASQSELRIDSLTLLPGIAKIGKDVYIAPFACISEYAEAGR